jgi:AraC-like DNA-binding protein
MNYALLAPPKSLQKLVKCFWMIESSPDFCPDKNYLMADTSPEIIFQYKGGFKLYAKERAYIRVQHVSSHNLALENEFGFFGVRLFPGSVQHLTTIPAHELSGMILCLNTLFKQSGRDLTDRLLESIPTNKRIQLFGDFLQKLSQKNKPDAMMSIAHHIDQQEGHVNLSRLCGQTGLSVKQFERRFKATTGFPPKLYARIARFQSTKRKYVSFDINSLTELAYACNYYDQSHFTREFTEFSGVPPSHYFGYIDKGDNESKIIKELIIGKEKAGLSVSK